MGRREFGVWRPIAPRASVSNWADATQLPSRQPRQRLGRRRAGAAGRLSVTGRFRRSTASLRASARLTAGKPPKPRFVDFPFTLILSTQRREPLSPTLSVKPAPSECVPTGKPLIFPGLRAFVSVLGIPSPPAELYTTVYTKSLLRDDNTTGT